MTARVPATLPPVGLFTKSIEGNTNVEATTTAICPALDNRRYLSVTNLGNKDVWCAFGKDAVLLKGDLVPKNGGILRYTAALGISNKALNGISESGTIAVAFMDGSV